MSVRKRDSSQLVGGLVLILMGAVFLLDRLDVVTFRELVRTWWPMGMIIFGVYLAFDRNPDTRFGAFFMITIGVIFQIGELELFRWWRWKNMWPLMMIVLGGWMLAQHFTASRRASQPKPPANP